MDEHYLVVDSPGVFPPSAASLSQLPKTLSGFLEIRDRMRIREERPAFDWLIEGDRLFLRGIRDLLGLSMLARLCPFGTIDEVAQARKLISSLSEGPIDAGWVTGKLQAILPETERASPNYVSTLEFMMHHGQVAEVQRLDFRAGTDLRTMR